ncbi:MAG TPA: glycosyl hydrolase family 18 protein [Candidatus Limnocylindrales bacterium]|nr:glycosyl hydrolase family 18 protein [Candidatus Limnocylindrales bacterium]
MIHRGAARRPAAPGRARLGLLVAGALLAADAIAPAFAPALVAAGSAGSEVSVPPGSVADATTHGSPDGADRLDLGVLARSDGSPFAGGAVQPGVQYEDALAHADDPNTFTPGGRVTVGFRPRAGDAWPVDGRLPVALPAGRATGRAMIADRARVTAAPAVAAPVDQASRGDVVDAAPAAFEAPSPLVTATGPVEPAASSRLRRQVFGFLPYWELGDSSTVLNYSLLSTIAYFSVGATKSGRLKKTTADGSPTTGWAGWTSSAMTKVINNAHSAGSRVVLTLSVFAWSSTEASVQASILGSSTNRLRLAQQTAAAIRDRGADGVNLDFEPIASGYADEFVSFVKTLRSELDKVHKGYQLTFDTTGYVGNYKVASLISAGADAMFLMGYDFRTSGSSPVGSISPIAGPAYDIRDSLDAFLGAVPASRIILGVPYYGRAWSTTTSKLNAKNQSGAKYGYSVSVNYENAVDVLAQYGKSYDSLEQVAWTAYQKQNCTTTYGCVTTWRQLYVDDPKALGAKYDLVNRLGLRGVGMWALGYDGTRPELYDELNAKFLHDTTLPEAGIRILPAAAGDEGFVVRWTGSDDVGVTGYDVQVATDGGSWNGWKSRTTATSDVWLGADGHTYAFRVRARDTSGNWSAWNVAQTGTGTPSLGRGSFGTVVADGLSLRTAPDTSATKVGTASSGDVYAITGGPVSADGYTWYEVTGPLSEWNTVGESEVGLWLAANGSGSTFVDARRAPNATAVDARLTDLGFAGLGDVSLGAPAADRLFSPNGDGRRDTLRVGWTNQSALDTLSLEVFSTDGTDRGSVDLSAYRSAGAQSYAWNGRAGGSALADGRYVLQLVATDGGATYTAPSARPVTSAQVDAYAVTIDRQADGAFTGLGPSRILDTRIGLGLARALANRSPRTLTVAGRGGVPSDATAVSVNVTVTGATSKGYLAITKTADSTPSTSTLNVSRGQSLANGITLPLASDGSVSLVWVGASGSHANVILDVTGYLR